MVQVSDGHVAPTLQAEDAFQSFCTEVHETAQQWPQEEFFLQMVPECNKPTEAQHMQEYGPAFAAESSQA